ncbi:pyrroline-5-carboxylate reductase [candidate division KSB1 bacterium]|nr:pyrroline-5-carboxylate reductase [candidate division KSB1 bacterium]
MATPKTLRIAVIGGGKIGEALLGGLLKSKFIKTDTVVVTTAHGETALAVGRRLGVKAHTDNLRAVHQAQVVIIATKPKQLPTVCASIRGRVAKSALVVSLATGVSTEAIERALGGRVAVVRAMPNTPIAIGKGMTVLCRGRYATDAQLELTNQIFSTVGQVATVDEELMNASTGLSASGPAYVFVIIESLAEAGVKVGLPRELATRLAAQAVLGAAAMVLESGKHPALLKDSVTTPAGVTIDGLMELEQGGLRVALIKAIMMSTRRAAEIQASIPVQVKRKRKV